MARRVFNSASLNGTAISVAQFVDGSGEIILVGKDVNYTTDDHVMHNIRLNEYNTTSFKVYGNMTSLSTNPDTDVFGGTNIFYLDSTAILQFEGVTTCVYDENKNETLITIRGEAEDA